MKSLLRLEVSLILAVQLGGAFAAPDESILGKEAGYPIGTANTLARIFRFLRVSCPFAVRAPCG